MGRKAKVYPERFCAACGKLLQRKRYRSQLEDGSCFLRRKFCDQLCMGRAKVKDNPTLGALRARTKREVRREERCDKCHGTRLLGIHHLDGDCSNNTLKNVVTLCASCHTRWHWQNGKKTPRPSPPCVVCGAKSRRHRMCQKHYFRFKKHGDPLLTMKAAGPGRFYLVRVSPTE